MLSAYQQLHTLIISGQLRLYLLLAPPRTGSTATCKWFANTSIDGLLVEPWAKFQSGDQRLEDGYQDILQHVESLLSQLSARPVSLLIKVVSQHVGPWREFSQLLDLTHKSAILIRNPVVALESQLVCTAELMTVLNKAPSTLDELAEWLETDTDTDHLDLAAAMPL